MRMAWSERTRAARAAGRLNRVRLATGRVDQPRLLGDALASSTPLFPHDNSEACGSETGRQSIDLSSPRLNPVGIEVYVIT